jgi:uncharacterized membrane protein
MESIIAKLIEILAFLPKEAIVLVVSALPVIELRGAIPVGISLGMTPLNATLLSFFGSMIPVPFILLLIRKIFDWLGKTKLFHKLITRLTEHSLSKNGKKIQKYGIWGLILVVAIPLPGTGVWSGSLISALLNMPIKRAFPAIAAGNAIAAIAVLAISYGLFNLFG